MWMGLRNFKFQLLHGYSILRAFGISPITSGRSLWPADQVIQLQNLILESIFLEPFLKPTFVGCVPQEIVRYIFTHRWVTGECS